jgi:glycosyltransferase involved in cell wall biosynthesis
MLWGAHIQCLPEGELLIIAFDTYFLADRFRNVGIYEYAKNLFEEFQRLTTNNGSIEIRYFVSGGYSLTSKSSPGFEAINTQLLGWDRLWRRGLVSYAAMRAHADLIFSPSPLIVPLGVVPVAVTIHDAIPIRLSRHIAGNNRGLRMFTWVAARMSHRILTDSEHSKKDLVEIYNLSPEKVSVVHLGYDRATFNSSPVNPLSQSSRLERLGIQGPYVLHHGMVQKRKNLAKLIDAYAILLNRHIGLGYQLVLAGPYGFGSEEIRRMADDGVTRGKVIFTGPLPGDELAQLIKGASLCVIPSLYEGFCLPMVEAMACGVPTIASNSSCIPEISGGILRYFDPQSEEDMAATILAVLEHSDLQKQLVRDGLKRASQFSWRRCAEETLGALMDFNGQRDLPVRRETIDDAALRVH